MKEHKTGIGHLIASTGYSLSGICMAIKESAFRQELFLGAVHFLALAVVRPSFALGLMLTFAWTAILIVELLNTAIETVVDRVSQEYHDLSKRAKDIASAAVFVTITAFIVGWVLVVLKTW